MATTYSLAPIPIWIILEPNGQPAAGVIMYPRSSLNHDVVKNVYQDSGGLLPWPLDAEGGIVFNGNGTQGPFYWENTGVANDFYYLTFYDADGQLIYTIDKYPQTGGGGSGPVTNLVNIDNFIIDGQFSYNVLGSTTLSPVPAGTTVIQETNTGTTPQNAIGGWFFVKAGTGATDSISIPQSSLSDSAPANPRNRFVYSSTATGTMTQLDLMFQIPDVKTFSNQELRFSFLASATGSAPPGVTSEVVVRQYFGSGGAPSGTVNTPILFTWPAVETVVPISITVPSTAGKSRGTNNDDTFSISIRMPLASTGVYSVTNVMGVQGTTHPSSYIYDTQNEVFYKILSSIVNNSLFQTGDIVMNWNLVPGSRPGWALFGDNTTFGQTGSSATYQGTQYFNLFSFLWDHLSNVYAPVTPPGRGVTALADWNAGKNIQVPFTSGRAMINAYNSAYNNGQSIGANEVTLSIANLAPHTHNTTVPLVFGLTVPTIPGVTLGHDNTTPQTYTTTSTGSATPFSIIPPETAVAFWIKL